MEADFFLYILYTAGIKGMLLIFEFGFLLLAVLQHVLLILIV